MQRMSGGADASRVPAGDPAAGDPASDEAGTVSANLDAAHDAASDPAGRLGVTLDLDLLPTAELLRRIHDEDARVAGAVAAESAALAAAVDAIAARLAAGGRMFYVGAGTSARIAALDAAELPPTYGTAPSLVQV